MQKYTLEVQENEGGAFVVFPDDAMEQLGWKEGDSINWQDNGDGSWSLTKKEEMEWVLVETIQQYRMRYMVQVPKGKSEWALDTVVYEEAKEFSQKNLGETIVSHRVVSEEEAIQICDVDNDYTKTWSKEQKMKSFFTKDGEKVEL